MVVHSHNEILLVLLHALRTRTMTLYSACGYMRTSKTFRDAVLDAVKQHVQPCMEVQQAKAFCLSMLHKNVFITGGAGTGKSYTLQLIKRELEIGKVCTRVVAPTGLAAVNVSGQTMHELFCILPRKVGDFRRGTYPQSWMMQYDAILAPSCDAEDVQDGRLVSTESPIVSHTLKPNVPKEFQQGASTSHASTSHASTSRASTSLEPTGSALSHATNNDQLVDRQDDEIDDIDASDVLFVPVETKLAHKAPFIWNIETLIVDEVSMMNDLVLSQIISSLKFVYKLVVRKYNYASREGCSSGYIKFECDMWGPYELLLTERRYEILKECVQRNNPLGAINFIFVGDFAQLPPIYRGLTKYARDNNYITQYVFQSLTWRRYICPIPIELDVNKRVNPELVGWLELINKIRDGQSVTWGQLMRWTRPTTQKNAFLMRTDSTNTSLVGGDSNTGELQETFAILPHDKKPKPYKQLASHKVRNSQQYIDSFPCVQNWNEITFARLPGPTYVFEPVLKPDPLDKKKTLPKVTMNDTLVLKPNCTVQVTKNQYGKTHLCPQEDVSASKLQNGTLAVFQGVIRTKDANTNSDHTSDSTLRDDDRATGILMQAITTAPGQPIEYKMYRSRQFVKTELPMTIQVDADGKFSMSQKAMAFLKAEKHTFNLACANGVTVHKVQGQTITMDYVIYPIKCFEPGMLYVILTRSSPERMRIDCNEWLLDWEDIEHGQENMIKYYNNKVVCNNNKTPLIPRRVLEFHSYIRESSKNLW